MRDAASSGTPRLRRVWQEGGTAFGMFLFTRLDPVVLEAVCGSGYDYVCIDMQHGLMTFDAVLGMIGALAHGDATPIVRVPSNDAAMIGRVLDAGAHGVIVPMVNSGAEAARAVAACRYAPQGERSFGPLRARILHGADYAATANETVLCIPMIETAAAVEAADGIISVPGVDAIYVGPSDLSLSYGMSPLIDNAGPFPAALARIVELAERHEVVAGIHANAAFAQARQASGFRMVTVSNDLDVLSQGFAADLSQARTAGTALPAPRTGY